VNDLLFQIHNGLPREGPGDRASTHRAYAAVRDVAASGCVLDVGCGPGAQTIDLGIAGASRITAIDQHLPYLDELSERARAAGLAGRVHPVRASMFALPFARSTFDVVWAEGAIYIIGFARGLQEWRALLRPGGFVVVTHLSWLRTDIPDEPRAFWTRHYPAIRDVQQNVQIARESGFDPVDVFTLPESAWWTDYYTPLEARLASLRDRYLGSVEALSAIEGSQQEIDLYRRFGACYGYVFYVLRAR
jgi:SAM-dependent methyltransferase